MAILETIIYSFNEVVMAKKFEIADIGGSIIIHTFGAYFGLGCTFALHKAETYAKSSKYNESSYNSNLFAMIGTVFLWMYWPSFNGALG